MCPESVAAGADDWHNAVGTGPFILTDYVDGSGATYTKNPAYWGKSTINGKEYQLPLVDKLIYPIITDESTAIAALRTGKTDWAPKIKVVYQNTLASSVPALTQQKYLSGVIALLKLNRLKSQFVSDKNIRRALMIGTDLNMIANTVYGGGEIVDWPIASNVPGFTPLSEMPASQKELYTYDVAKAKKLIADAGYPDGFTIEIATNSDATNGDLCAALTSMWAKFNVTVKIKIMENTALTNAYNDVSYKDAITSSYGVVNPFVSLVMARWNYAGTVYKQGETPDFETMFQNASSMVDATQRTALIKSFSLAFLDDVGIIPFTNTYVLNCYWPWLKNYHGELETGYYNGMPMIKRMWIDNSVKATILK
jgi:peptide/nickel transport system substrate-binding protein